MKYERIVKEAIERRVEEPREGIIEKIIRTKPVLYVSKEEFDIFKNILLKEYEFDSQYNKLREEANLKGEPFKLTLTLQDDLFYSVYLEVTEE